MTELELRDVYTFHDGFAKRLLWDLLIERPTHANISHNGRPRFEDHERFVDSRPYRAWYLINADLPPSGFDRPFGWHYAGAVYATNRNEIGIAVFHRFQRLGLAAHAIRLLVTQLPPLPGIAAIRTPYYVANVAPENEASHALFESLGCTLAQLTYRFPEKIS